MYLLPEAGSKRTLRFTNVYTIYINTFAFHVHISLSLKSPRNTFFVCNVHTFMFLQSLHIDLFLLCTYICKPLLSLQVYLFFLCSHSSEPIHSTQKYLFFPCSHFFDGILLDYFVTFRAKFFIHFFNR